MSYLSIVVIAFLAVTAYVGVDLGAEALRRDGASFYKETNFRDEEIISTLLLSESDMEAIRALNCVTDAEGVYQTSGRVTNKDLHETVSVLSLPERINLPRLVSGRLPETTGECVVEQPIMEKMGLSIGDKIEITDAQGEMAEYLRTGSYVITGVILHPDHMAWPDMVPGDRYILVLPEDFDHEALDGCFMKAEIMLEKPEGIEYYDAEYLASLKDTEELLSALAEERAPLRYSEIHDTYQAEIDDGQEQLDDAREQLDDARTELDDGWDALADGEQELTDAESQLADGRQQLDDAWQELLDAKARLESAEAELASAKAELDSGDAQLSSARRRLDSAKAELADGWNALEDAKAEARGKIRVELESILGDTSEKIAWASRQEADYDSSATTAMELWITEDYKFDLNLSLEENIIDFLCSFEVSDDMLIAAYENMMGGA